MISANDYIKKRKLANLSPETLEGYSKVLKSFAKYLNVPCEELHNHLTPENLTNYADSRISAGKSNSGTATNLRIIHRFYKANGIVLPEDDLAIIKNPGIQDPDKEDDVLGKPVSTELLQKMMDSGTAHSRAIISFLISTGCRAGEASKLKLTDIGRLENDKFVPDINGSVVNIRHAIAKGKVIKGKKTGGGLTFLSAEAREFLNLWLKERDEYVKYADAKAKTLKGINGRPAKDDRLFANSYNSMQRAWDRLYMACDGEKTTNSYARNRCTLHSCRAYFRTHAPKGMSIDIVEKILRHKGYLTQEYVKYGGAELEKAFHAGESVLYITRADHRIQTGKLSQLERENQILKEQVNELRENFGNFKSETAPFEAYLKRVLPELKPLGKRLTYEQYLKEIGQ